MNIVRFDAIKMKRTGTAPSKNFNVGLNTLYVAAVRTLVSDCLRVKKGLDHCTTCYENLAACWPLVKDWKLSCHLSVVAQCANYYVVAHGPIFKLNS